MTLADTNLGSMTATVVTAPTGVSKVEGIVETAPAAEEKPPEAVKTQPENRQPKAFDVLARKERAILRERQQIAADRAVIQAQQAEITQKMTEYQNYLENKSKYKTNPKQLLQDHGLTYQELAEYQLNDGEPTPALLIKQQQERIDALETRLADKDARNEAAQKQQQERYEQEVVADFRNQIETFVRSKPDQYEFIRINEAENLVYDTVEEYYKKNNTILPIKKAADMVEDYLSKVVDKITASKKLQARFQQRPTPTKAQDTPTPRTLSNSITTTSSPYNGLSARTEQDRISRAIAKLEGR